MDGDDAHFFFLSLDIGGPHWHTLPSFFVSSVSPFFIVVLYACVQIVYPAYYIVRWRVEKNIPQTLVCKACDVDAHDSFD